MDYYQETFETWDKVAREYQDKFMTLDLYDTTYDIFYNSLLVEKPKVLEIGCGPGNITKYLLKKNPFLQIHGIDVSPNMINLSRANNPGTTFSVLDARDIGEINTNFDGIISGFCIPYLSIPDTEAFILNSKQLLNENGILYLSFIEGDNTKSRFLVGKNGGRVFCNYHLTTDIIQFQESNDFKIIEQVQIPYIKNDETSEIHSVLISMKISPNVE